MATKIDLLDSAGAAINFAYNAIHTKKSEIVNISQHNDEGVVVFQVTTTCGGSPKFKVYAGMSADALAPVLDSTGAAIEFTFTTTNTIFHLANLHATFVQWLGSSSGSTSGAVTGITMIAK